MTWDARLFQGDCIAVMTDLDEESVDAVVCDPPYGIEFMGKDWDKFIPQDQVKMHPRWANAKRFDPTESAWGDGESERYGKLPSYGGKRTSSQCQRCGKRDAFRNPHACGDQADWRSVPSYEGASPDVLAFEQFSKAWAEAAYRVLKPGGHLLAFGATRMYHRLASGVEDAGFEIRDSLHWIYGSGFPKSMNVALAIDKAAGEQREDRVTVATPDPDGGKRALDGGEHRRVLDPGSPVTEAAAAWDGWGTALKPAHEPVVLARKPLAGTVAETVIAHGTGALNIGASRVGFDGGTKGGPRNENWRPAGTNDTPSVADIDAGRWPANVLLAHLPECQGSGPHHTEVLCAPGCPVAELNEASGDSTTPAVVTRGAKSGEFLAGVRQEPQRYAAQGDSGGAARFFYVAKPKTRERVGGTIRNLHPTVKPIDLMRYLVRLVTPPGGIVLDPFLGSGTTGCAAMVEGVRFVGIERDADSFDTSLARISDYAFAHGRARPEAVRP